MRRSTPPVDLPEFPDNLQWLNVEAPLRLRDLGKKIVLLNFFTSCCIHCTHVIRDLNRLLSRHAPELVVIGVHSPKLSAERDVEALRDAVVRHGIDYPVVNDRDMQIWRAHGVQAWPTTLLVSPEGRLLERRVGEGIFDALDDTISDVRREAGRRGGIDRTWLKLRPEREDAAREALSFPAGLLADERAGRLFISDTGNNRIVVAGLDGRVIDVAGTGEPGIEDGSFDSATFREPRGLALDGCVLYVADRGNHSIRSLDLSNRSVRRVAGTGRHAPGLMQPGDALKTALNSPWDFELIHHRLYIAMAGAHQIWRLDLHSGAIEPYAGDGAPGLIDDTRSATLLAQPSGITSDGIRLFFVDAATSALRWLYLPPGAQLGTWIGQGLFKYGDVDGNAQEALLQHPLGVTHCHGLIYVADTWNHKIKVFNPRPARIITLIGTGEPGYSDGEPAMLNGPSDLCCADGRIWIADTNNHAIRVAPIDGGPVTTLQLHPREWLLRGRR